MGNKWWKFCAVPHKVGQRVTIFFCASIQYAFALSLTEMLFGKQVFGLLYALLLLIGCHGKCIFNYSFQLKPLAHGVIKRNVPLTLKVLGLSNDKTKQKTQQMTLQVLTWNIIWLPNPLVGIHQPYSMRQIQDLRLMWHCIKIGSFIKNYKGPWISNVAEFKYVCQFYCHFS